MSEAIRIVLADDHEVVRQGIRALLEAQADFEVVGEASDGLQVADLVEREKPHVLVVDLMMPGLGGLDVARKVRRRSPKTRIVVLSMHASVPYVYEAMRIGVTGYVVKDAGASELVGAIREAAAGRRRLGPPLSEEMIEAYARKAEDTSIDLHETLTAREREILHLAAEGMSSADIARRLGISPRTAETHRANVMRKLGVRNRADLIRYALSRGIVPLESQARRAPRRRSPPGV
jgi:DNA-binding NarL/FixJ family response regulator